MKKPYYLLFALAITACGNSEKTNEETTPGTKDSATAVAPEKTAEPAFSISIDPVLLDQQPEKTKKILSYFFSKQHAIELLSVTNKLQQVKTDAELYACYHFADSVCNVTTNEYMGAENDPLKFMEHIDSISSLYHSALEPLLPFLQFTCEAECSVPRIMLNYEAFSKLALKTTGKQDDRFFAFYKTVYPDCNCDGAMQSIWFDMTWDYGGNSMLGSGNHYKVLKMAQEAKKDNLFAGKIKYIEERCMEDALTYNTLFYTAEKAVEELKKIKTLDTGSEKKLLIEKRIQQLQSPGKDLQLDCEHRECMYG